jgi:nucleotide-binding universal stress UspA family protein
MFKKLLVPLDWSEPCTSAVAVATAVAAEQPAEIVFLHVQEPVADLGLSGFAPVSTTVVEATKSEIEQLLAGAASQAAARNVASTGLRETGPIPETILSVCKREACDLIVIGTHGRTGLSRAFVGSVTEAVLRHATVPVLAVHTPEKN